jgi:ABC-2 type transport system permease protein
VRVTWALARAGVLELLRIPTFSVPTLALPALALLLIGVRRVAVEPSLALALYAALALLGVCFFQFGVGIAAERSTPWHATLRTLPAPAGARIAARALAALAFGAVAALGVAAVAVARSQVALAPARWPLLAAVLLAGSVPPALLGVAIGLWLPPRGALPCANVLYLSLSYVGGLWTGGRHLPAPLAAVAPVMPTRVWAKLLGAAVGAGPWRVGDALVLVGWGALFACLAAAGYARDETQQFR